MTRYREVSNRFVISKVAEFGKYLSDLAMLHCAFELEQYAAELTKQASDFDMSRLPETLARFPEIVTGVQTETQTGPLAIPL